MNTLSERVAQRAGAAMQPAEASRTRAQGPQSTADLIRIKNRMNEILAQRTGQPLEKIQSDVERDHFLEAEEAKEYGLVDEIIPPRR